MKVIYNKFFPWFGYDAINMFGILFVNTKNYPYSTINRIVYNHESIHTAQMKEMLYIFFYIWYVIEWFIKLFKYGDSTGGKSGYSETSFEREAYANENNDNYLDIRKHFAWFKYIRLKNKK